MDAALQERAPLGRLESTSLVLLPGLDGTGLLFQPLLGELQAKVIAYPANEPLDLSDLAALVVRQLPREKVCLLAESFSGLVALTLLMNAPARIRGVIFVAAFAEPPRPFLLRFAPLVSRAAGLAPSAPSFLLRQYCLGKEASAAQLQAVRKAIAAVSPGVLAQRLGLVAARHSFGKAMIEVPCCYIRASEDRLVPPSCANWFRQRFRKCEIVDVPGPHFLLQANPRQAARIITKMVDA